RVLRAANVDELTLRQRRGVFTKGLTVVVGDVVEAARVQRFGPHRADPADASDSIPTELRSRRTGSVHRERRIVFASVDCQYISEKTARARVCPEIAVATLSVGGLDDKVSVLRQREVAILPGTMAVRIDRLCKENDMCCRRVQVVRLHAVHAEPVLE